MYIRKPPYGNKVEYVNLKKVAYVNQTKDDVVLNMCVSYGDSSGRIISCQHFLPKDYDDFFGSDYFIKNFVKIVGKDRTTFVNKNYVTSVIGEFANNPDDNKIIVLFANSVSKQSAIINARLMQEYLYVRVGDIDLNSFVKSIVQSLD